jgi:hypothetical protein
MDVVKLPVAGFPVVNALFEIDNSSTTDARMAIEDRENIMVADDSFLMKNISFSTDRRRVGKRHY